ncbi:hypothetical protein L218DRAFT_854735 [Marasmius fiardii PR-910]|nr:hypothetical protein L218DRAFT_854735 [Marasmius fiardii PR-910]
MSSQPPYFLPFDIHFNSLRSIALCDGLISPTCYAIEPKALDALGEWFQGRPVLAVGPLYPSGEDARGREAKEGEFAQTKAAGSIERFLDEMLEQKGKQSVLYVSFGSSFSTVVGIVAESIWAWIDVVLDMNIPVIVAYPPQNTPLPDELQAKVDASKITLICQYAPQQYILSHAAVGWFLTHNGLSGTVETLQTGIPMISWPICADQPVYAMLNSLVLKTGYELHEVRRGHGLRYRPSYDKTPNGSVEAIRQEARDILTRAFFDEKEKKEKRSAAEAMQAELEKAWQEGQPAKEAMKRFVSAFLL